MPAAAHSHAAGKNGAAHRYAEIFRMETSYSKSTNNLDHDASRSPFQLSNLLWAQGSQLLKGFCQSHQERLL